jgi:hypothetical protein
MSLPFKVVGERELSRHRRMRCCSKEVFSLIPVSLAALLKNSSS